MRVGSSGAYTVQYQHVGLGMVAEVDYPVIDVQLDLTVSHDGKRNNQGFTSQTSGNYPGWDRFGRVKKHAWVDGLYTTGTGGNPNYPPLVELNYTYDRSSNRLTRTDARPGASWGDRDFRYEYDGLDRLVQADRGAEGGSWSAAVGGQQWALDMLGNWDSIFNDTNGDGNYTSSSPDEEQERTHNFANEIEDITSLPFAYDAAGNMTEQGLPAAATKYYTHDAWNRLTAVSIDAATLGEYEYNALHWRTVKRSRTPGAGSLDEMRLMYYSANWQLLEERIDRSWTSGFTEDERAQTFWGKRYIDDAVARRRDRDNDGTYDNNFFYVTDAQFSTVATVSASNARVVERITYDAYGKARHHFGGDVTGDGAATAAGDDAALVTTIGLGSNSIGQANYKAEQDLNRDGQITTADRTTLAALTGGADQAALASGLVSFTTTGSGGSTIHGPDNPIAWDGYVFNAEIGQYLARLRWYDPVLGRWLERDPVAYFDSSNLYEYIWSNPSAAIDPTGATPSYAVAIAEAIAAGDIQLLMSLLGITEAQAAAIIAGTLTVSAAIANQDLIDQIIAKYKNDIWQSQWAQKCKDIDPCEFLRRVIDAIESAIASYDLLVHEHSRKLRDYSKNPWAFDNEGRLLQNKDNPDRIKQIIERRKQRLWNEIQLYRQEAKDNREALKKVKEQFKQQGCRGSASLLLILLLGVFTFGMRRYKPHTGGT